MRLRVLFVCLLLLPLLFLGLVFAPGLVAAQNASDVDARRAQLQAELEKEEQAIAIQTALLAAKQKDTATVAGEVALLKSQISQAQARIKAKKAAIANLQTGISQQQNKIETLAEKIKKQQNSLAELIRHVRDLESLSFVEVMLSDGSLTEIFNNVDSFAQVEGALHESFRNMRSLQEQARQERLVLEEKKNAEIDAQQEIEQQTKIIEKKESERSVVLKINQNQTAAYQKLLQERQQRAAQIRAALFALRDTAAIPFGKALEYATLASAKTGVRPALILAVLTQESNLGEHQGSCLLSSLDTGNGVGKNTGTIFEQVMKAPRDTTPFRNITARLGLDWRTTPVSCPPGAKWTASRGYGGGMGPSQFIPSTWELFKKQLGTLLNLPSDSANPWDPAHAFLATAIYLNDLGAKAGSYTAERNAACRYYSGAACQPGRRPANVFYGDEVMAKAQDIQLNMIDPLQNN